VTKVTYVSRLEYVRSGYPQPKQASAPERPYLPVGVVALSAALGVLVVASAYTAGRHGVADSALANYGYWAGQALIFIPASIRLLTRRGSTEAGTVTAIMSVTVGQYLSKLCYSPLSFSYSDELSHWRTAENILSTGKLFTPNYALPISPQYPGLEEATTALVQITGLPLFTAGVIVAGVAHVLFVMTLYLLFRNIGRSRRLAGIAVLVYSTNPGLAYFDSLFAYQTLGLAFMGVALVAAWRLAVARSGGDRTGWAVIAMVLIVATVATHHVTSYMLTLTLVLVAVASLLARDRRSAARSGALALWAVIVIAGWLIFVAPQTVSYLLQPVQGIAQSFSALLNGGHSGTSGGATSVSGPLGQVAIEGAAVLLLSSILPVGWLQVRRQFRDQPWVLALTLGSLTWYAILLIRLGAADGSELSGRAASFVYVPSAFIAALGFRWLIDRAPRMRASAFLGASLAGVLLMSVDGLLNSWPPSWERLPGPHQVGGVERSIGPEEIAVGNWLAAALGPGNRITADFGNDPMVGTYGNQTPVDGNAFLYLSPTYTQAIEREALLQGIQYVLTDLRLTQQLPASGQYFPQDPNTGKYTHPLPLVDMTKFNNASGVTRIFDSGDIVIYDLFGGQ
jgi:hypothetical protein